MHRMRCDDDNDDEVMFRADIRNRFGRVICAAPLASPSGLPVTDR